MNGAVKHKAVATWLALFVGVFGLHRFYLHGLKDRWAWAFPLPTLLGLAGLQRMDTLGQDDRLAWVLMPLLGVSLVAALIGGIVYGLMPDERWNSRYNSAKAASPSGWGAIIGVIFCVFIGGIALMSTIAFSAQRYFESRAGQ